MREIQPADPAARRTAVLLLCAGTLAGLLVLWIAQARRPAVEAWLTEDPERVGTRFRLFFGAVVVVLAVPLSGLAAYFWRLGERILRADRFPPPDLAVVQDTIVLRGAAARRRGRVLQVAAVILIASVVAFVILLWRLLSLVEPCAT